MTPALRQLQRAGVAFELHEYEHDSRKRAYGAEAAEVLGLAPQSVFKTLLASLDAKRLAVGIVPVSAMLDLKALAKAGGAKRAAMATATEAQRSTGYVLGGISPFGQKKALLTVLDDSALTLPIIHVSGGRRGLEIAIAPADLIAVLGAKTESIST